MARVINARFEIPSEVRELLAGNDKPVRFFVEFNFTRSPAVSARLGTDNEDHDLPLRELGFADGPPPGGPPALRELPLPEAGLGGESEVDLRARSTGEGVQVVAFYLETESGEQYIGRPADIVGEHCPEGSAPEYEVVSADWDETPPAMTPESYVDEMLFRIPSEADALFKLHFFTLDFESHPLLLPLHGGSYAQSLTGIGHAMTYLPEDMINRAQMLLNGTTPETPTPWGVLAEYLRPLMDMQRALIEETFYTNLDAYEYAFRNFANGALRFALTNGMITTQPSGAGFFLFGEFAIAATKIAMAETTPDPDEIDFWLRLAGIRVSAQRIYMTVYPPYSLAGGDPGYEHYNPCSFTGSLDEKDLESIAPIFGLESTLADIEYQAATNVKDAFPGLLNFPPP